LTSDFATAGVCESVNRAGDSIDGTCDSITLVLLPRTLAPVVERTTRGDGVTQALGLAATGCGADVHGSRWCGEIEGEGAAASVVGAR
jgi:hypothetical protein